MIVFRIHTHSCCHRKNALRAIFSVKIKTWSCSARSNRMINLMINSHRKNRIRFEKSYWMFFHYVEKANIVMSATMRIKKAASQRTAHTSHVDPIKRSEKTIVICLQYATNGPHSRIDLVMFPSQTFSNSFSSCPISKRVFAHWKPRRLEAKWKV